MPLQSKPLMFLRLLVERHGKIVTREELATRLWPDTHVLVDQGLNAAVRKIRLGLEDDAAHPRYLETLGSRGYRFIADVTEIAPAEDEEFDARPFRSVSMLKPEIVEGVEQELANAFLSELGAALGKLNRDYTVIFEDEQKESTTSTFSISSKFRYHANNLRMETQLIRNADAVAIAAFRFEAEEKDVSTLADRAALQITGALTAAPIAHPQRRIEAADFAAYEEYLRGRHFWAQRTQLSLKKSIECFERAVAIDPKYAPAYAGLADAYNMLASYGLEDSEQSYSKALEFSAKALELAPGLAEALVPKSWALLALNHQFHKAASTLSEALEANPSFAYAYHTLSFLELARRNPDSAETAILRAKRLEPLSQPINTYHAFVLYYAHRFDECIERCMRIVELDPRFAMSRSVMAMALTAQGETGNAIQQLEIALELSGGSPMLRGQMAYALAVKGDRSAAQRVLQDLCGSNGPNPAPCYQIGLAFGALGEQQKAAQWISRAYDEHSYFILFADNDPALRKVKDHGAIARILNEIHQARRYR